MGVKIDLRPYDPAWRAAFQREAERLLADWPDLIVELHHIGSTSVPGLIAKPIVDIAVAVWQLQEVDLRAETLTGRGYEAMGEFGIAGRRYFRKESDGAGIHLHVFQAGDANIRRHLRFRDYLIAHPETAQEYANLKQELAKQEWETTSEYAEAKTEFIRGIEARAAAWQRGEVDASG